MRALPGAPTDTTTPMNQQNTLRGATLAAPIVERPSTRAALLEALQTARTRDLRRAQRDGIFRYVQVVTHGDHACAACKQLAGHLMTLEDTIATPPLPCPDCTTILRNGWANVCRCSYVLVDARPDEPPEPSTRDAAFHASKEGAHWVRELIANCRDDAALRTVTTWVLPSYSDNPEYSALVRDAKGRARALGNTSAIR